MENSHKIKNEQLVQGILKLINRKLMTQYKRPDWQEKMGAEMYTAVKSHSEKIVADVFNEAIADSSLKVEKIKAEYKDYIKKPSKSFGTRLKFLFKGEL